MELNGTFVFLALGMLFTGSINTLATAWANETQSIGRDGVKDDFKHPFFQALGMFLGEMLCLLAYKVTEYQAYKENKPFLKGECPKHLFVIPAALDMTGTSVMYLGLTMSSPSVFQMLRGSVVIFTGILSVVFLKRKLYQFHWAAMGLVVLGVAVVGLASVVGGDDSDDGSSSGSSSGSDDSSDDSGSNPLLGNILIIAAQLIVAVQMVVEETLLSGYQVPALQAVGLEGVFGFSILLTLLLIFQACATSVEDSYDALVQASHSPAIVCSLVGNTLSIAFFNFFGISVTKVMSASHRMVLDSVRTIIVWAVSLCLGWESFSFLQVIGFVILLTGTVIYNEVLVLPSLFNYPDISELEEYEEDEEEGSVHDKLLSESESDKFLMEDDSVNRDTYRPPSD